ncbi:MAG: serine/threonine protein kinase [Myxococcales bacterium]|nr:serine/threonine protein kinase [Myxococcales bacterium]
MSDEVSVDPHVGLVVGGRFRVEELLGSGGMARVYRATQLSIGEDVAIKFLARIFSLEPDVRERFRREALALARLRHPGIVSVIDYGEHDGELYIVMELLKGQPLSEVLEQGGGKLPLVRLSVVFDQLLAVLEAAHAAGIVHRDLKPSNVMLLDAPDSGDRIKLLDFGLAHVPTEGPKLTQTGLVQGTPAYMSPEQCKGEHVAEPADVYAVGVMLYEAMTGRLPFEGGGAPVLMSQHMFVDPPPMSAADAPVAAGLEEVVRQALAKRAEDRPTVSELRALLASALKGTDPVTMAAHATEERRRGAALTRSERALTSPKPRETIAAATRGAASSRVALACGDGARAESLRATLGVRGVAVDLVPPEPDAALGPVAALVVDGGLGEATVKAIRGASRVPFLVFDVPASAVAGWVRAGAGDVTVAGADDAEISRKLERILRRGR